MQILDISGNNARCVAKGIEREVSLFMLQNVNLSSGDFVLVHVGYAIQKVNEVDALTAWELHDAMADVQDA